MRVIECACEKAKDIMQMLVMCADDDYLWEQIRFWCTLSGGCLLLTWPGFYINVS